MKYALCGVLALVLAAMCRADDKQALAERYISAMWPEESFGRAYASAMAGAVNRELPTEVRKEVAEEALKYAAKNFRYDQYKAEFGRLVAAEFTEQELRQIVAFAESPAGKKLTALSPSLIDSSAKIAARQFDTWSYANARILMDVLNRRLPDAGKNGAANRVAGGD